MWWKTACQPLWCKLHCLGNGHGIPMKPRELHGLAPSHILNTPCHQLGSWHCVLKFWACSQNRKKRLCKQHIKKAVNAHVLQQRNQVEDFEGQHTHHKVDSMRDILPGPFANPCTIWRILITLHTPPVCRWWSDPLAQGHNLTNMWSFMAGPSACMVMLVEASQNLSDAVKPTSITRQAQHWL